MTANRLLVLVVVLVLAVVVNTIPAHGATLQAPKPKAAPKAPEQKLYIYPKLIPPQRGEEIIRSVPKVDTSKWA